jgi:hypothetical protein
MVWAQKSLRAADTHVVCRSIIFAILRHSREFRPVIGKYGGYAFLISNSLLLCAAELRPLEFFRNFLKLFL